MLEGTQKRQIEEMATVTIPDALLARLRVKAEAQDRSVEELTLDILTRALESDPPHPALEEVVAEIRGTPPDPSSIRPAIKSLAALLRDVPGEAGFDLAAWQQQWAAAEAEMKSITRVKDLAEGRG